MTVSGVHILFSQNKKTKRTHQWGGGLGFDGQDAGSAAAAAAGWHPYIPPSFASPTSSTFASEIICTAGPTPATPAASSTRSASSSAATATASNSPSPPPSVASVALAVAAGAAPTAAKRDASFAFLLGGGIVGMHPSFEHWRMAGARAGARPFAGATSPTSSTFASEIFCTAGPTAAAPALSSTPSALSSAPTACVSTGGPSPASRDDAGA
ncbi:hypothetical protein BU14_0292s0008 [Porphyra umbilicalis]|uniref:Uncharacterized protein n=1 Tax=Porphyra umbilicalis TaxID=2786 RepID=A0A1X6P0R2_PORUM|nr:hypothetical protein BU14_0292s0008 [Porphyra umbilicalis]|eukprot:OSX74365.1 hypothetical protein BU14_0292s0008 [Porphyra umbilicalis]